MNANTRPDGALCDVPRCRQIGNQPFGKFILCEKHWEKHCDDTDTFDARAVLGMPQILRVTKEHPEGKPSPKWLDLEEIEAKKAKKEGRAPRPVPVEIRTGECVCPECRRKPKHRFTLKPGEKKSIVLLDDPAKKPIVGYDVGTKPSETAAVVAHAGPDGKIVIDDVLHGKEAEALVASLTGGAPVPGAGGAVETSPESPGEPSGTSGPGEEPIASAGAGSAPAGGLVEDPPEPPGLSLAQVAGPGVRDKLAALRAALAGKKTTSAP